MPGRVPVFASPSSILALKAAETRGRQIFSSAGGACWTVDWWNGTGAAESGRVIESLFSTPNLEATKKMLEVAVARHEALAGNIANIETPGYKRVDLSKSFATQLKAELARGGEGLAKLKPVLAPDDSATVRRSDGNTVQIDQELLEMAGNTTNVEVLTQFVSGSLRQLRTAVLGRNL